MDLLSINRLATLSRQEVSKNDVNKEYLMKILKFLRSKDPNDPNLTRQLSPKYIPKSNRYKNTQISPNGLASEKKYVAESLKSFLPNIYSNKLINDPQTRSIKVFKVPIDVENKVLRKPVQLLRQYSSVLKTSKNDISKSSEMQQNQDEHSSWKPLIRHLSPEAARQANNLPIEINHFIKTFKRYQRRLTHKNSPIRSQRDISLKRHKRAVLITKDLMKNEELKGWEKESDSGYLDMTKDAW